MGFRVPFAPAVIASEASMSAQPLAPDEVFGSVTTLPEPSISMGTVALACPSTVRSSSAFVVRSM